MRTPGVLFGEVLLLRLSGIGTLGRGGLLGKALVVC